VPTPRRRPVFRRLDARLHAERSWASGADNTVLPKHGPNAANKAYRLKRQRARKILIGARSLRVAQDSFYQRVLLPVGSSTPMPFDVIF
jgi:hypothetical protein